MGERLKQRIWTEHGELKARVGELEAENEALRKQLADADKPKRRAKPAGGDKP